MPAARRRRPGQRDRHGRGADPGGRPLRPAAGAGRGRRGAVRLLHARVRRRRHRLPRGAPRSRRGRGAPAPLREHLPLHRLRQDRRRGGGRRRPPGGGLAPMPDGPDLGSTRWAAAPCARTRCRRRPGSSSTPTTSRPRGCCTGRRCARRTPTPGSSRSISSRPGRSRRSRGRQRVGRAGPVLRPGHPR